ncbi:MAG: hypothetical protein K0R14_339 [Burkholderiales bacterium]|jgi:PAS domain S-box-containing protein|nr:hypothetical protein [Burkholderiales bacterium]
MKSEYRGTALENIIEYLPAHIYWKDVNGKYLGCNMKQARNLGLKSSDEIIGKTDFDLPWPEKSAEEFRENDIEVIKKGIIKTSEEKTLMDGHEVVVLSQKVPLKNEQDEIIGVLGISLDITDRKEAERVKIERQASRELQHSRLRKVVAQVAHDIRSPAASLNMLMDCCTGITEQDRVAIRRAITRINDIANNLLGYFTPQLENETFASNLMMPKNLPLLVSADLLEIITEKRYEYSQLPVGFISNFSDSSYFAFISVESQAFARSISNLINNAVDAFEGKGGEVIINFEDCGKDVKITIEDRGKGISDVVINKIRNAVAVTDGKIAGHGIGYSQVRNMLEQNNGALDIQSDIGGGTKVTLTFPKISAPNWIADKIDLNSDDMIVILDDDPSIHDAWESRFNISAPHIWRKHFDQGLDAVNFLNNLTEIEKKKVFLLTDYELLKQGLHGLNVIEKTRVERSILVTSHYNNRSVRELAAMTKTRILPKLLAAKVKISVDGQIQPYTASGN